MWEDGELLAKRYEKVSDVDVGGIWEKWWGEKEKVKAKERLKRE